MKRDNDLLKTVEGIVQGIFLVTAIVTFCAMIGGFGYVYCNDVIIYYIQSFIDYNIKDGILIILASLTLIGTIYEYESHRERVKAEVLGQYNERYSRDEHINKVVPFLIEDIMNRKVVAPSVHNVEMFMRFFEEMELQIEKDRLDAESVYKLFSYYALYLDSKPYLIERLSVDDYNVKNWELYLNFIQRMAKINFKGSVWWSKGKEISFDNEYIIINGVCLPYTYQAGKIIIKQESKDIEINYNMRSNNDNKEELVYDKNNYTKKSEQ